ncbi:MAG TPA: lmo0937 family membrane protein [Gemmatimonadales bacterium]|nr:lmo0937 family membrane protein [Gemmatimonadales bacterium]
MASLDFHIDDGCGFADGCGHDRSGPIPARPHNFGNRAAEVCDPGHPRPTRRPGPRRHAARGARHGPGCPGGLPCSVPWRYRTAQREASMIWLAVLLVVAWLLGWGVFHVAGGLIHLLLVIAVVVFLINFISGRRTV